MILNVMGGVQAWLNNGAIVLVSIGVLIATALARRAGASSGWVWFSYLLVIGALLAPILGELHAEPYDLISFFVLVAILVPGWALWLAIEAPGLAAPDAPDEPMDELPAAEAAPVGG
jgi:MFS family permease